MEEKLRGHAVESILPLLSERQGDCFAMVPRISKIGPCARRWA